MDPDVDVKSFAHHMLVQHRPGVPLPEVDAAHVLLHNLLDQLAQRLVHHGRAAAGDGAFTGESGVRHRLENMARVPHCTCIASQSQSFPRDMPRCDK